MATDPQWLPDLGRLHPHQSIALHAFAGGLRESSNPELRAAAADLDAALHFEMLRQLHLLGAMQSPIVVAALEAFCQPAEAAA
jgi:hypothetical protein